MEPAIAAGRVNDLASLEQFLLGRLHTAGVSAAVLTCAACSGEYEWDELDRETDARTPSPALRASSKRQGRQLLRAAVTLWPGRLLDGLQASGNDGPHHCVALGAAACAAGLGTQDAARCSIYSTVSGPAGAAVKLLGLDPLAVHGLLAQLAPEMEAVANHCAGYSGAPLAQLPCPGSPLLDLFAQGHAEAQVRLFAS